MTKTSRIFFVLAVLVGCAGEGTPTCDEAVAHYYAVGCVHYDGATGAPLSLGETQERCEMLYDLAPTDQCVAAVEAWVACLDDALSETTCDCERERAAVRDCD